MSKSYRSWSPDHPYLLPPDPRSWLPDDHLAHFVLEVVGQLDISKIEDPIQRMDPRGERPYAPRMMLGMLIYAYCTGVFSSRRIERRSYRHYVNVIRPQKFRRLQQRGEDARHLTTSTAG